MISPYHVPQISRCLAEPAFQVPEGLMLAQAPEPVEPPVRLLDIGSSASLVVPVVGKSRGKLLETLDKSYKNPGSTMKNHGKPEENHGKTVKL